MISSMLFNRESKELLREFFTDNFFDALVTDPPAGIGFMGAEWDSDKGGRDAWITWLTGVMRECYRVLKPGAHGLVWAIPRTSHWTAMALEHAGFEVRDVITHHFGSGFPKSLDVSKAIDKAAGAEREVVGRHTQSKQTRGEQKTLSGGSLAWAHDITAPATDAAKKWQGFGTSLKPASEHWVLVRRPISEKTVVANVLKYSTGALNIDGCRIGTETRSYSINGAVKGGGFGLGNNQPAEERDRKTVSGRFPANLILSEGEAVTELDRQSGTAKPKPARKGRKGGTAIYSGGCSPDAEGYWPEDYGGGASRFFYVAKASKKDRGIGNTHPTVKSTVLMDYLIRLITPVGGIVLDPFTGSGSTGVAAVRQNFKFVGIENDKKSFEIAKNRLLNERVG